MKGRFKDMNKEIKKYFNYDMDELSKASIEIVEEYGIWMKKVFNDASKYEYEVFAVQRRIRMIKNYLEIFKIEQMLFQMNPSGDFVPNVKLLDETKKCIDEIRELIKD